ncbi:glycosyltransferase family 32 protein [Trichocladium antarcticum]|uniref:Glycosyltransferase family 32 protein n=1 Tax=Trichocladium antarcticum TaxID=1450529 RepID=A0AAN6URW9_9PEZI|nr:glycosyltransferase family 32 protein [Trichocladium antarcticum]
MRISLRLLWVVPLVACLGYVLSRLLVFKQIFFAHAGIAITQPEVVAAYPGIAENPQHIPKIIHQVFHNWKVPGNDTLPAGWAETRQTCIDLNPHFEIKLWTEKASREFIEAQYPWFLNTYDGYRYPVQRVDAVKYFLMQHYGGIYIDLDNGCNSDLTPLLYYPLWVTDGDRGTLSNNIIGSRPNHPFWDHLTRSLLSYNWNWLLPFVTISYASGQWFETAVWEEYHAMLPPPEKSSPHEHRLYRVLMDGRPGADPWVLFNWQAGGGGTWNNWDNQLFWAIGQHLFLFSVLLFAAIALVVWLGLRFVRRLRIRRRHVRLEGRPGRVV